MRDRRSTVFVIALPVLVALCCLAVLTAAGAATDPIMMDLAAWYKADALGLADGETVTNWPDSSGNGIDAGNQYEAGRYLPAYKTGAINGHPAVRFTWPDHLWTFWGASTSFTSDQYTIFAVVAHWAAGPPVVIYDNFGGTGITAQLCPAPRATHRSSSPRRRRPATTLLPFWALRLRGCA